jgi:hypothetical protein
MTQPNEQLTGESILTPLIKLQLELEQVKAERDGWKSKADTEFRNARSHFVRTEVLEAELSVVYRRAESAENELSAKDKDSERIKNLAKEWYQSDNQEVHRIAVRILRDPDRYPGKIDEGKRFS